MTYPELAAIDSTTDQDTGLTIAFKLAVNQRQTPATTPGEYLAARVTQLLDDYASAHIGTVQVARVSEAFAKATDKEKQEAAAILKVDLAIDLPPDKP